MKLVKPSNPILHKRCKPIPKNANMLRVYPKIDQAMVVMLNNNGLGIAAPQVGIDKQFFIAVVEGKKGKLKAQVFINSKIIGHSEETAVSEERCLSYPGTKIAVERWCEIVLEYWDINMKLQRNMYKGLDAAIIQHEHDHLQGITIMDKKDSAR